MKPNPAEVISIRQYERADDPFLEQIAHRLNPGVTASPRDPSVLADNFASYTKHGLPAEPGRETFVAVIDGRRAGVISVRPDTDYFTKHPRAYVEILVVTQEAEGQGVGRALLARVEAWARANGFIEVVLDVFAGNRDAIAFYDRVGYQPDHIRLTKPLT